MQVDHEVPELTCRPVRTAQQPPPGDDRPADTGRDGHVDEVIASGRCPEPTLAERRNLRVTVQGHRKAQRVLDARRKRDVVEGRTEVRRVEDGPGSGVDRARCGDADPDRPREVRSRRKIVADFPERRNARGDDRFTSVFGWGMQAPDGRDRAPRQNTGRTHLGAAEVERKDHVGSHPLPLQAGAQLRDPFLELGDPCPRALDDGRWRLRDESLVGQASPGTHELRLGPAQLPLQARPVAGGGLVVTGGSLHLEARGLLGYALAAA